MTAALAPWGEEAPLGNYRWSGHLAGSTQVDLFLFLGGGGPVESPYYPFCWNGWGGVGD